MSKLSRDLAVPSGGSPTLHPREIVFSVGNLAAANAELVIPADGAASFMLDVRGTYVGTLTVEGSLDGTNWITLPLRAVNGSSVVYQAVTTSAATGVFLGRSMGLRLLRVRMVAYTSGLAVCTLAQNAAALDDNAVSSVTSLVATSVGAAGAAVTLTLAAPGAGLRQYISYLAISRFATALLTAGAAPVTVTTTNLPGSLAFSFPAEAAPAGSLDRWREDFAFPLAASAPNTAVTIVCPATTNVIWRVTAGYYLAP